MQKILLKAHRFAIFKGNIIKLQIILSSVIIVSVKLPNLSIIANV
jgi:hypothetical protein